jgi:hypothetical protein
LFKITSFLLLAIWLPTTLHCLLEASGLCGESHHADCCAGENGGKADLCATLESSLIKEAAPILNLAAPCADISVAVSVGWHALMSVADLAPVPVFLRHAPPLGLAVGWQFVTRAAPPSRAPSAVV